MPNQGEAISDRRYAWDDHASADAYSKLFCEYLELRKRRRGGCFEEIEADGIGADAFAWQAQAVSDGGATGDFLPTSGGFCFEIKFLGAAVGSVGNEDFGDITFRPEINGDACRARFFLGSPKGVGMTIGNE